MSTVIYLANQNVHVVIGSEGTTKISVKNIINVDAPEGTLINGIVMNETNFVEFIKDLWATKKLEKKGVKLVIASNKIASKNLNVPEMNRKNTVAYIAREFADMERETDDVYSFTNLGKGDGKKINIAHAEVVSKDFIKHYVNMFKKAGVELGGIWAAESAIINFVGLNLSQKYKNFVFHAADGNIITNILFVDGRYVFYNSIRIFSEQGTDEYIEGVGRAFSQINQFMQSNKQINVPLDKVVIAGYTSDKVTPFKSMLTHFGIDATVYLYTPDVSKKSMINIAASNAVAAVSGLCRTNKGANFLDNYVEKEATAAEKEATKRGIIAIVVAFVVMALLFGASVLYKNKLQDDLAEAQEYNESPMVVEAVTSYDETLKENLVLQTQIEALKGTNENIQTYPVCNDYIIATIEDVSAAYATVTISSFNSESGVVEFVATSKDVSIINQYIKDLSAVDIFKEVEYTGYALDENTGEWEINVNCILAEGAGRGMTAKTEDAEAEDTTETETTEETTETETTEETE